MLHIPQSSSITEISPSDCLASYTGHSLQGWGLPLCRDAVGVIYSPSLLGNNANIGSRWMGMRLNILPSTNYPNNWCPCHLNSLRYRHWKQVILNFLTRGKCRLPYPYSVFLINYLAGGGSAAFKIAGWWRTHCGRVTHRNFVKN